MNKPFLKWAGNKFKVLPRILPHLGSSGTLYDAFMGSGSLMLNRAQKKYVGGDINQDLIDLFDVLKSDGEAFIAEAKELFIAEHATSDAYYRLREVFNTTTDRREKAMLFLYLNKHCFNGLSRYNPKTGWFNVPWNHAKNPPAFPIEELQTAIEHLQNAKIVCASFEETVKTAKKGDVVYFDPPYLPVEGTEKAFTEYAKSGFELDKQKLIVEIGEEYSKRGITVVVSNHSSELSRELYKNATIEFFDVGRSMGRYENSASSAKELLAVYTAM